MEKLKNKHILLDTCFIIKSHQYLDTDYFTNLFLFFKNNSCVPVVNNFIRF